MAKDRAVASPVVRGGNPAVLAYCATQNHPIHWLDTFDKRKFVLLNLFFSFFFRIFSPSRYRIQIFTGWITSIDEDSFCHFQRNLYFFFSFFFSSCYRLFLSRFQPLQMSTPDIYWLDHIDRRRFVLPLSAKSLFFFPLFFSSCYRLFLSHFQPLQMSTPFFSSPLGLAQPLPRDIAPSTLPTGSLAGIGAGPPPIGFLDGISLHFHVRHSPQQPPLPGFH